MLMVAEQVFAVSLPSGQMAGERLRCPCAFFTVRPLLYLLSPFLCEMKKDISLSKTEQTPLVGGEIQIVKKKRKRKRRKTVRSEETKDEREDGASRGAVCTFWTSSPSLWQCSQIAGDMINFADTFPLSITSDVGGGEAFVRFHQLVIFPHSTLM